MRHACKCFFYKHIIPVPSLNIYLTELIICVSVSKQAARLRAIIWEKEFYKPALVFTPILFDPFFVFVIFLLLLCACDLTNKMCLN